jgi:RNA polymerase sigma factor (TIGR02999 family)
VTPFREPRQEFTRLLIAWGAGDRSALDQLLPTIYDELRKLARSQLRREQPGHTLQTTALVHEAFLRLVDARHSRWDSRAHFFGITARLMRQILVDHARTRDAAKRGGGGAKVPLDEALELASKAVRGDVLALDEALQRLESIDHRQSQIVELRFFGGLTVEETSEVLDLSPGTVKREWTLARAWLWRALRGDSG